VIVFDLKCGVGHVFEAWFGSSGDYRDQQDRGLVSCPICGDGEVDKAPMAPAVPAKGSAAAAPAEVKQMLGALAEMQKKLVENSDWVGDRFASEARAIHLGEVEARQIHGRATKADADSLIEEGIPVAPLPLPIPPPEEQN
jgi:hypothetical protein